MYSYLSLLTDQTLVGKDRIDDQESPLCLSYPMPYVKRQEVEKEVHVMLEADLIELVICDYNSPIGESTNRF